MSQTWQTVLLSLATSLIVSFLTFVLGLKSGKNQTDRAKLQNLYKNLYSHFSELKESLQYDRPKSWESYKKVERGLYSIEYYPPVKELKRTGDLLFIKKKIADDALSLELQVVNYSYELMKHIPEIHAAFISNMGVYKEGYIFKKYQKNGDEKAHFETANPKRCNTFWPKNYCLLYNREETEKLFQQMQKQDDALTAIEFTCDGNPADYSVRIYPEGIKIGWREYVDYIFLWLEKNVNGYTELCRRKKSLILQIDKLNKKLERKAKEPVGFWETIIGAFADMFR